MVLLIFAPLPPPAKAILANTVDYILQLLLFSIILTQMKFSILEDIGITVSSLLSYAYFLQAISKRSIIMVCFHVILISYLVTLILVSTVSPFNTGSVFLFMLKVVWYILVVLNVVGNLHHIQFLWQDFGVDGFLSEIECGRREEFRARRNLEKADRKIEGDNVRLHQHLHHTNHHFHINNSDRLTGGEMKQKEKNSDQKSSNEKLTVNMKNHENDSKEAYNNERLTGGDIEIYDNNSSDLESQSSTTSSQTLESVTTESTTIESENPNDNTNIIFDTPLDPKKKDIIDLLIIRHVLNTVQKIYIIFSIILIFMFISLSGDTKTFIALRTVYLVFRAINILILINDVQENVTIRYLNFIFKIFDCAIDVHILIFSNLSTLRITIGFDIFIIIIMEIMMLIDLKGVRMELNKVSEKIEWRRMHLDQK